jgi:hypothetical protein
MTPGDRATWLTPAAWTALVDHTRLQLLSAVLAVLGVQESAEGGEG